MSLSSIPSQNFSAGTLSEDTKAKPAKKTQMEKFRIAKQEFYGKLEHWAERHHLRKPKTKASEKPAELAKKVDTKPVDKTKEKAEYDIDWIAYAFGSAI